MPWKRDGVTEPYATIRLIAPESIMWVPAKLASPPQRPEYTDVYVVLFDDNARTNTPFKSPRVYVTSVMTVFTADVE